MEINIIRALLILLDHQWHFIAKEKDKILEFGNPNLTAADEDLYHHLESQMDEINKSEIALKAILEKI